MVRICLDTETSGLGVNAPGGARPDGVCELGIAWLDKEGTICSKKWFCNPGEEFLTDGRADGAFKINGFTTEGVRRFPPVADVAKEARAFVKKIAKDNDETLSLAAYNSPFDSWFLSQEPWHMDADHGFPWEQDLMERAAKAAGVPVGTNGHRFRLDAAMKFAQLERYGNAHDAESDAIDIVKLARWLDERELSEAHNDSTSVEELTTVLNACLIDAKPPGFPRPQPAAKPGTVNPSDLWRCPVNYWKLFHGEERDFDRFFEEVKRPISNVIEKMVLDRYENAGIRTIRAEYCGDGMFSGKLDGRVEWPPRSGKWIVVEVKSVWGGKELQYALAYPSEAWASQMEIYLRCTGIDTAVLEVFRLGDPDDEKTWETGRRAFHPDDSRWAALQEQGRRYLALQAPDTKKPVCDIGPNGGKCWKCKRGQ